MKRSQLALVATFMIAAFLFSGCYVNDQGVVMMGGTPSVPDSGAATTPDATTEEMAVTESAPLTGTVNTRSLRVRQEPSTETPVVAGLRAGTEITITGRNADGAWLQIEVPDVGGNGWVSSEYVIVVGDVTGLAITDGNSEDSMTPVPSPTAAPEPSPTATSRPASAQIDLVQTASAISEFSTLVTAVDAAGLVEILSGEGPFTVFAPTNDAFAALPTGTLDALLADPEGALTQVLLFHVVPGRINAADISDGLSIESAQGEPLVFAVDGANVSVNGAPIVITDLEASNGVIHVIDAVLVPSVVNIAAAVEAQDDTASSSDTASATPEPEVEATPEPETEATPEPEAEATTAPTQAVVTAGEPVTLNITDRLAVVNTGSPRSLRVRDQASANGEVIWGARNGEYYAVVDQTDDGVWVGLAIPELAGTGWVSSEFVTITEEITLIPTLGSVTVTTSDGARLRVRRAPSVDAELLDYLEEGETYEVVAVTAEGDWALINIPDTPGPSWISTEFVQIGAPQR